jgi:hypothetical protein
LAVMLAEEGDLSATRAHSALRSYLLRLLDVAACAVPRETRLYST